MKTFTLLAITILLSPSVLAAVPCANDPAFVHSDLSGLEIGGLAAQGTVYDTKYIIGPDLILTLVVADETEEINPGNTIDLETGILDVDCASFLSDTFWIELALQSTEPNVELVVNDFGPTFNPALQGDWNINYDNNFPDDLLSIQENGDIILGGNPGVLVNVDERFIFDLQFTTLFGTDIRPGGFSGTFNSQGESGEFDATPSGSTDILRLGPDGRLEVIASWIDGLNIPQEAMAVPLTNDSGAFYSSNPTTMELALRIINRCDTPSNSIEVFAAAKTDVEYEITITDTQAPEFDLFERLKVDAFKGIHLDLSPCP